MHRFVYSKRYETWFLIDFRKNNFYQTIPFLLLKRNANSTNSHWEGERKPNQDLRPKGWTGASAGEGSAENKQKKQLKSPQIHMANTLSKESIPRGSQWTRHWMPPPSNQHQHHRPPAANFVKLINKNKQILIISYKLVVLIKSCAQATMASQAGLFLRDPTARQLDEESTNQQQNVVTNSSRQFTETKQQQPRSQKHLLATTDAHRRREAELQGATSIYYSQN